MRRATATLVLLVSLLSGAAAAESLVLTGTVRGMGAMSSPKSTLHYILVGPDGASGKVELPMDRGASFLDSNTFDLKSKVIELPEQYVGLVFGRLASPGEPDMWIPVVQFSPKAGQDEVELPDLQARSSTLAALLASYPFQLEQPVVIDHSNLNVVLAALKMQIEDERVRTKDEWGVLFQFFHRNKAYLTRADDITLKRVLDYMYTWYRAIQIEGDPASSGYPEVYVKFLNAVVGLEIGGRVLPGGQRLRSYLTETLKQVYAENRQLRDSSINDTLQEFLNAKWYEECLDLSAGSIVRIAEDLREVPEEDRVSKPVARSASTSLRLFSGCAQAYYVDNTTFGWLRDFEVGFEYVWHELDNPYEVRSAYMGLYDVVNTTLPKLVDGADRDAGTKVDEERVSSYYYYFLEN